MGAHEQPDVAACFQGAAPAQNSLRGGVGGGVGSGIPGGSGCPALAEQARGDRGQPPRPAEAARAVPLAAAPAGAGAGERAPPADAAGARPSAAAEGASVVQAVFGGLLRSDVTCCECGFTSTAHDPFLDISLDLQAPPPRPPPLLRPPAPPQLQKCAPASSLACPFRQRACLWPAASAGAWQDKDAYRRLPVRPVRLCGQCAYKQRLPGRPPCGPGASRGSATGAGPGALMWRAARGRPSPKQRVSAAHAGLARARKAAAAAAAADAGGVGESGAPPRAAAACNGFADHSAGRASAAADAEGPDLGPPTPASTGEDASPSPQVSHGAAGLTGRLSGASAAGGASRPPAGQIGAAGCGGGARPAAQPPGNRTPRSAGGGTAGSGDSGDVSGPGVRAGEPGLAAAELAAVADTARGPAPHASALSAEPMDCGGGAAASGRAGGPAAGPRRGPAPPEAGASGGADGSDSAGRGRGSSGEAGEGHRSNAPDASAPPTSTTDGASALP